MAKRIKITHPIMKNAHPITTEYPIFPQIDLSSQIWSTKSFFGERGSTNLG